jgi:hypothetical protein
VDPLGDHQLLLPGEDSVSRYLRQILLQGIEGERYVLFPRAFSPLFSDTFL